MVEMVGELTLDGLASNRPATVQPFAESGRRPVDIERLLWWAMEQTGYLPWKGVSPRELMFDHGYTVLPRGCSREYHGGGTLLRRAVDEDAATVIAAIMALDPVIAGVVIRCAREKIRPDWMPGVEPKQVQRPISWRKGRRKRGKRGHRAVFVTVWEPCDPAAIRAARAAYEDWHEAVNALAAGLAGMLIDWKIKGFRAPRLPWGSRG